MEEDYMKIYTKTGDTGETSLFTGQRVPKNDPFIEALGTVDECNCAIGAALALIPDDSLYTNTKEQLVIIQHALFDLGAGLATPRTKANNAKINKTRFDLEEIELIEKWIDEMSKELPQLHTFILPGGTPGGAMLHLARSMCRRAERLVVPLNNHADVSEKVIRYLNRLSDYLFMVSRHINHLANCPETSWKPHLAANKENEHKQSPK